MRCEVGLQCRRADPYRNVAAFATFSRALGNRTLRLIGDSLMLDQYRHLARCVLNCSFADVQLQNIQRGNLRWTEQMEADRQAAGIDRRAMQAAYRHLVVTSSKETESAGCMLDHGGRVQFRRLNQLPHAALVSAIMHLLLYLH